MFGFGKKRKSFQSNYARQHSGLGYRKEAARERSYKNKLASIKALFFKFAVFSILAGSVYLVLFSPFFMVKNIVVRGDQTIDPDDIRSQIRDSINYKILKIFPNTLVLAKTADMESLLREKFSSINDIKIAKKFPGTLAVTIIEKPIDISWCNRIRVERVSQVSGDSPADMPLETYQCYFSDESNTIYKKAGDGLANTAVRVFRDDPIKIGDQVASGSVKDFIRQLVNNFNKKTNLEFAYLYMPPSSSREMHVIAKDGWKIYFDLNRGVNDQLDVLNNVYKDAIPDADKKNLDYVDLRVVDRVPWKPK